MTAKYYQKHKEMLERTAPENYQNLYEVKKAKKCQYARNRYKTRNWYRKLFIEKALSEEEKNKKRDNACNWYKNLSEEEKTKSNNMGTGNRENKNYNISVS